MKGVFKAAIAAGCFLGIVNILNGVLMMMMGRDPFELLVQIGDGNMWLGLKTILLAELGLTLIAMAGLAALMGLIGWATDG